MADVTLNSTKAPEANIASPTREGDLFIFNITGGNGDTFVCPVPVRTWAWRPGTSATSTITQSVNASTGVSTFTVVASGSDTHNLWVWATR